MIRKRLMMMSSCLLICITSKHSSVKFLINTIQRNVSSIMKPKKIEEDHLELILVRYALMLSTVQHILSARWEIVAQDHTIELKNFIILRSIKLSIALLIQPKQTLVIMVTCALLLIQKMKLLLICQTSLIKIQISTCFILKQFGAHIQIPIILEMHVYMHIIGRTLEESLIFLIMKKSNVLNGKPRILSKHMLMVVSMNIDVNFLMDGKNKNITHLIIKCMHADKLNNAKSLIALITTLKWTEDSQLINSLRSFLKIGVLLHSKHNYTNQYS